MMKINQPVFGRHLGQGRVAAFFCVILIIASPAVVQAHPPSWDVSIFRSVNDARSPFLTTTLGASDNLVLPIAIGAPLVFAGVGLAQNNAYTFDTGAIIGVTDVLAYVLYYPIKNYIVKRPRPYVALTGVHTGHLDSADKYSMPSGHTTAAFALATALTLRYPKPYVYIPAYAWAAVVGYGRMYWGLHYPSDVLAGALLGTASAFAIHMIAPQISKLREQILGRDIGIQLAAAPTALSLRVTF
jgi:membrane-associated phospholipid phosphatase